MSWRPRATGAAGVPGTGTSGPSAGIHQQMTWPTGFPRGAAAGGNASPAPAPVVQHRVPRAQRPGQTHQGDSPYLSAPGYPVRRRGAGRTVPTCHRPMPHGAYTLYIGPAARQGQVPATGRQDGRHDTRTRRCPDLSGGGSCPRTDPCSTMYGSEFRNTPFSVCQGAGRRDAKGQGTAGEGIPVTQQNRCRGRAQARWWRITPGTRAIPHRPPAPSQPPTDAIRTPALAGHARPTGRLAEPPPAHRAALCDPRVEALIPAATGPLRPESGVPHRGPQMPHPAAGPDGRQCREICRRPVTASRVPGSLSRRTAPPRRNLLSPARQTRPDPRAVPTNLSAHPTPPSTVRGKRQRHGGPAPGFSSIVILSPGRHGQGTMPCAGPSRSATTMAGGSAPGEPTPSQGTGHAGRACRSAAGIIPRDMGMADRAARSRTTACTHPRHRTGAPASGFHRGHFRRTSGRRRDALGPGLPAPRSPAEVRDGMPRQGADHGRENRLPGGAWGRHGAGTAGPGISVLGAIWQLPCTCEPTTPG